MDPDRDRISNADQDIEIRPKVMDLLVVLAGDPSRVFTVEELLTRVWPDTVTSPASVYNCLKELRAALGDDPHDPRYIETIPKRGYRLIAPVRTLEPPDSAVGPVMTPGSAQAGRPRKSAWTLGAMSLLALLVAGLIALLRVPGAPQTVDDPDEPRYVAVLPLEDISADGSMTVIGEGLARDMIEDLATQTGLRVIAYQSSSRFAESGKDVSEIGKLLGADLVVSGTLDRSDGNIVANLRMIDTRSGEVAWSQTIHSPAAQLHLARWRLGEVLTALPGREDSTEAADPGTSPRMLDTRAYELYLQARRLVGRGQGEALKEALEALDSVVLIEPEFTRARALRLDARWRLYWAHEETWPPGRVTDLQTHRAYQQGLLDEARALVEAAPQLAEAHLLLGRNLRFAKQHEEARASLERALELNASLGEAHRELGWLNHNQHGSWADTVAHFREAVSLDPYSTELRAVLVRGLSNIAARRDEMWQTLRDTKERMSWTPDIGTAETVALASEGRYADAIDVLENASVRADEPRIRAMLADKWDSLDRPDRARQLVADYESWRDSENEEPAESINRCPRETELVSNDLAPWAAYVCAYRRQPARTLELLQARFGETPPTGDDTAAPLGSEWSPAVLMAWAARTTGDHRLAESYAESEARVLASRSENGQLQSGQYFMLMSRLAAVRGEPEEVFSNLEKMLDHGNLNPRAFDHPSLDACRDTPEFEALVRLRSELVAQQLALLGLAARS